MKTTNLITILYVVVIFTIPTQILGEILHVPDDFETIQEAVDNANDRDSIIIAPGIYRQGAHWVREPANLSIIGSLEGNTIIDLEEMEGRIINGIYPQYCDITIENIVFRNIEDMGIASVRSHVIIRNCVFENISRAITINGCSTAVVEKCTFLDVSNAISFANRSGPTVIRGNLIVNCSWGIENSGFMPCTIINNTIVRASYGIELGGVDGRHLLKNNIITECSRMGVLFTSAPEHGDIDEIVAENIYFAYNCFWNNEEDFFSLSGVIEIDGPGWIRAEAFNPLPGTGMLYENPLFVDPDEGDYHLSENSPCINAGDPESPRDPDGTRADIGAFYLPQEEEPEIRVEPMEIDFGEVIIGDTVSVEMTISNDGNEILNIQNIDYRDYGYFSSDLDDIFILWEYWWDYVQTDNNMSCIILDAQINGEQQVEGSYIGVFTPVGLCAGYSRVGDQWPLGIAIWGDEAGGEVDGFRANEEIEFRLWDAEMSRECIADINIIEGENRFGVNDLLVCTLQGELEGPPEIEPGGSFEFNVYFSPLEECEYEVEFSIISNDPDDRVMRILLIGSGIIGVEIRVEPLELDFGEVFINDTTLQRLTIFNDGNELLEIQSIDVNNDNFRTDFINAVEPGGSSEETVYFTPTEVQDYEATLTIRSNDPQNDEVTVDLFGTGILRDLVVPLERNWNLISINVIPPENLWMREEGPDIIRMMEQLRIDEDSHHVLLIKNEDGRFYAPEFGFNNIPYWDLTEGYHIKVDEDVEAAWSGVPIPPDADIWLDEGWNFIAYFPTYELDARTPDFYVLSSIIDNVLIAKNIDGRFMAPQWHFSNMPPWRETQGYHVKVNEDVLLNYPLEQEENAALSYVESVGHWASAVSTGANMSILITSISGVDIYEGDQIGAFDVNGCLVGAGMIDTESRCGLAVWGDDPSTEEIDGLQSGEAFELRLWDTKYDKELSMNTLALRKNKSLVYETDSFVVLDVMAEQAIPENFYLANAYPNPFNATTRLSYGLPKTNLVSIRVYDVSGRLVATLVDGQVDAGHYVAVWNGIDAAAGIYIMRMESGNASFAIKTMLIK